MIAPTFEIHLLQIDEGGYCSQHRHARKDNTFVCLDGYLEVMTWPEGSKKPDVTRLGAGEKTTVPAGTWHQFKAEDEAQVLEIYTPAAISEDIERRSRGGLDE